LGQLDPVERLRWEEARWQDDVYWGRDRQTRRLLAFVGVSFAADPDPEAPPSGDPPRLATALFEYRDGRWRAEGKHLDEIRPDEAFFHHRQFVPVGLSRRRS
ncbi:MAG: hypothetical protein IRY99_11335, partial [Isosphaeraceae bacterium]|nr:hypothetical protein [Isosphaeraceae bacterium]